MQYYIRFVTINLIYKELLDLDDNIASNSDGLTPQQFRKIPITLFKSYYYYIQKARFRNIYLLRYLYITYSY